MATPFLRKETENVFCDFRTFVLFCQGFCAIFVLSSPAAPARALPSPRAAKAPGRPGETVIRLAPLLIQWSKDVTKIIKFGDKIN
jgi:hypothetical protein